MGVMMPVSWDRHEDRICSSMNQPTPCLQATGPGGEGAPLAHPTGKWLRCWVGRTLAEDTGESQLMPHTLKLQPERTRMLGKDGFEGASTAGVEQVASGRRGRHRPAQTFLGFHWTHCPLSSQILKNIKINSSHDRWEAVLLLWAFVGGTESC